METIETNEKQVALLEINHDIKIYLKEIAKWAKFLSIIGFIGIGIMLIAGIVVSFADSTISSLSTKSPFPFPIGFLGAFYIAFALLYFFPTLYLYKFSDNIQEGIQSYNQGTLTSGFKYLKSVFRFIGIMTIVLISIYLLVIVTAVGFAGMLLHR